MTELEHIHQLLVTRGLDHRGQLERAADGGVLFRTASLDIALSPIAEQQPHYSSTERFHLAYRASRDLEPTERDLLETLRRALDLLEHHHPEEATQLEQLAASPVADAPDTRAEPTLETPDSLIRITATCNQSCSFCNHNASAPDAADSPEAVQARLNSLSDSAGPRSAGRGPIMFTGGEPTLDPHLLDYVRQATARGLTVGLQTNAVLLAEDQLAARLWRAGARQLLVSLHGAAPALSDRLTGTPGDWQRTIAGLKAALDAGFEVGINTVICTENIDDLEPLVRLVHREFDGRVRTMVFSLMAPVARATQHLELLPRISDVVDRLTPAIAMAQQLGLVPVIPGVCGAPPCTLGTIARFSAELQQPAPAAPAPDRGYLPGCGKCAQRPTCSGLWLLYLERHGAGEFVPLSTPITPYHP